MPPSPPPARQPARQPQHSQPQHRDVAVFDGVLERVTFSNPETGYTIARIAPDRGTGRGPVSADTELVTAVGRCWARRSASRYGCAAGGPRM